MAPVPRDLAFDQAAGQVLLGNFNSGTIEEIPCQERATNKPPRCTAGPGGQPLRFAGDRFGGWPAQVSPGILNDPQLKKTHQVDVAVIGDADKSQPPLLALGEAKWDEVMGMEHLERLTHARGLAASLNKYDTTHTRLVCFSGAGFTPGLTAAAADGKADLISLDDLYGLGD